MRETYFLLEMFIIHRQHSRIIHQANDEKNSEFYTRQFWEKQKSQFHRIIDKQNISSFKGWIFFLVFQCCFISSHSHPLIRSLKVRVGQTCAFQAYSLVEDMRDLMRNQGLTITYSISSGEGNSSPLQYSCLENAVDGGAC